MSASKRLRLGVWLFGVLACAAIIGRTEFRTDLSAFLPRSPSASQQVLVEVLRNGAASRVILLALEGAPRATLASLSKAVAAKLRQDSSFLSVSNGADIDLQRTRDFLWHNRYLLSSAVTPESFAPEGLRRALERDLDLLASSVGAPVKPYLPHDPTGELLHVIAGLGDEAGPVTSDGVWFSRDDNRALLAVETRAAGSDIDAQQRALGLIRQTFAEARQATGGAQGVKLLVSGPGAFAVATRDEIERDAWRFSLLAGALVTLLLLMTYRSLLMVVLGLLPVASGALGGIAAVSLGFGFVHGVTLGFGVTLIGEAVDYAIYLFTQTLPGSSPAATLPRIWPTLRLGLSTSICGFGALLFSSFVGLAQLGLFSTVGLVVAAGVTRWIVPPLLPNNFVARSAGLAGATMAAVRHAPQLRLPLLLAVAAAVLLLALQHGALWNDELSSLSPIPQREQRLDEELRRDIGAPDVRYVIAVTAGNEEQALTRSEAAAVRLQPLVAEGALAGFDSPARYLPSQSAQRARQAALPAPDILRANLALALAGLPFRPDAFAPFLADEAAARAQPLLDRASIEESGLAPKLDALLVQSAGSWTALLPLRGVAAPERIAAAFRQPSHDGARLLDLKAESDGLYRGYRRQALLLSLVGVLAITLLLFASLRSPRRVCEVLAPLAGAVLVTAALLVAFGGRLSLFNLVGLLLVVGVGSNYALFFETQNGSSLPAGRTVASVALANLCTVIGFGVLSLSRVPVLHGIGVTVAIGAILSLFFSAILTLHSHAEN